MFINEIFPDFASASAAILAMVDHYVAEGWEITDPYYAEIELERERTPEEFCRFLQRRRRKLLSAPPHQAWSYCHLSRW